MKKLIGWLFHPLWEFGLNFFKVKLRYLCLEAHKTFRIVTRMAASHTAKWPIALASQHGALNSSCFIYKWKNLNWTFDVFILRLSAAICTQELTKLMTSTAVLSYFIHEANTKSSLHFTRTLLTLRLLMSYIYIYGAPSKARNANVVYIWTYVWQRWNSLFLFAAQCFNAESMQRGFLSHICV